MSATGPSGGFHLPPAAIDWLIGEAPRQVLTLSGAALPRALHHAGHQVFAIDKQTRVVADLAAGHQITTVVAQAESLPFDPCTFQVVAAHQVFHRYAPGLVLSEMARVLRPGGHAAVSYLVRDDSVPWVRRLVGLVQQLDPSAMTGAFGDDSVGELLDSKYFPTSTHKSFRHWVPTSREALVSMAANLPVTRGLDAPERQEFLASIEALYDESAPGADSLRLPYTLRCWRANVDHQELTAPIEVDDTGLVIPI
ncbi:class I SAM-dependent methyltransferase [Propionibacteriaceae bacterium Y1923]|uniref:class I SAM-dependent methyltransferase n=1 Tax=Aestuariimicrobium sp. Y1814 TaxID=3418742 RepID=UPI003C13C4AB